MEQKNKSNCEQVERLNEEVERIKIVSNTSETEEDDPEYQDALEDTEEDDARYISSESESDTKDEPALSEEEIKERKVEVLQIKEKGNEQFKSDDPKSALVSYSKALKLCPKILKEERSVLYSNRAATKVKLGNKEGALKDCTKAVELNPVYVKALLRRAKILEELDQLDKALEDYKQLNQLDPNNAEVKSALITLPRRIEEQTEKLKKEMMGKMKDLGNLILKPFGLSTDNFQINQDPSTGSYSVNMKK